MQAAQLRLYQGRFFLIPESEVEAFDNCRAVLETTSSTSEMSKAQLQYAERFLPYEVQKIDVERLQIDIMFHEKRRFELKVARYSIL